MKYADKSQELEVKLQTNSLNFLSTDNFNRIQWSQWAKSVIKSLLNWMVLISIDYRALNITKKHPHHLNRKRKKFHYIKQYFPFVQTDDSSYWVPWIHRKIVLSHAIFISKYKTKLTVNHCEFKCNQLIFFLLMFVLFMLDRIYS